jgi:hypothetical protein
MKLYEAAGQDLITIAAMSLQKSIGNNYMSGNDDTRPTASQYEAALFKVLSVHTGKTTKQIEKQIAEEIKKFKNV